MAKAARAKKVQTTDGTENYQFTAETGKVLKLMIGALYTNSDIFLRELISNASDACDKLKFEGLTDQKLVEGDADFAITLMVDEKARMLTILDNGIGMSREELIQNLGTIARSGTQEFMAKFAEGKQDASLIGQFGVGFYSSFMVADKVTVTSRKAGEEVGHVWESDGEGSFTVAPAAEGTQRGTRIELHLREGMEEYLDSFRLEHIVKTYSDHIPFPVRFFDEEKKEFRQFNKGAALWTRGKSDITEDEYKQFYKHVSHLPDFPWMTLHNKVEGALEYTSLLFIPTIRPFDLFHPDRMRRVKLYVKRVFITEDSVEVIPAWMRFLRGVVDSQDLPLNISRETLQHNQLVTKIQQALTKRVLSELKKKAESDAEAYAAFWKNFGAVLKEGLCEAITDKEPILEVCRFTSSATGNLVSLDEYIAAMPEGQEHVYYFLGDDVEAMQDSPQLEGFRSRGYDVLLFDDHVDSFWVNVVHQYKGKGLQSVTKAKLEEAPEAANEDKPAADAKETDALIAALKATLGEEVRDVRITHKLTESPVCLAINEGDMDIRMERFLVEQKQLPGTSAKILEINPGHAVIKKVAGMIGSDGFADAAHLLLDQARIVEGEEIRNPAAFARRLTVLMGKGF
ncbi:molecular chaperone HtpG [bacterium]|nr:molecular chaperone HtpG [bacterium]